MPGGDITTVNPSGNPGEEKSAADEGNLSGNADEANLNGNVSREDDGVADDLDPSLRNPGEEISPVDADPTRGVASAVVDRPSETGGGHPVVTAGAPSIDAVVGPWAAAGLGRAVNNRRPSSTLAWLLVLQVQFLAILSLVDSVGSDNSWLSSILREMR